MRCIWHVCAVTVHSGMMGSPPSLTPADQGSSTTDRELHIADEMRYEPGCLAVPLDLLSPLALRLQTGPAERLLALHLHQRARLKHITIWTYYREASIPAMPHHWLRLLPLRRRLSRLGKAAISSRPAFYRDVHKAAAC
jgi:hypothetical protein